MRKVKTSYKFLLVLAIIPFLMANVFTLKDGHDWGGDFAQYIRHAKNMLEHKDYASDLMLDQWVVTPPGFSLLLIPILKYFGLNFIALKSLNVLFWLLFVIVLYLLFRKRLTGNHALLGALVFLSSPDFFIFKHNIVSDISFLFFLTAALYTFTQYADGTRIDHTRKMLFLGLSVALMSYAFLIRWAGISLFISAVFYLVVIKRNYLPTVLFVAALFVMIGVQALLGVTGAGYLREIPAEFSFFSTHGLEQISSAMSKMFAFFIPMKTMFSIPIFSFITTVLNVVGPILLLGIVAYAVYRIRKKSISYLGLFFVVYLLGILLWPVPAGRRYIFPLVGLSVIFLIEGFDYFWHRFIPAKKEIQSLGKHCVSGILILLLVHNVLSIMLYFQYDPNVFKMKKNSELIDWVKHNTDKTEHFMFHKPRVLGLLTDRVGAAFWIDYQDEPTWYQRIDQFNIKYVIFPKESTEYITVIKEIGPESLSLEKEWENSAYVIYRRRE